MEQWIVEHIVLGWYKVVNRWYGSCDLGVCDDFGNIVVASTARAGVYCAGEDA